MHIAIKLLRKWFIIAEVSLINIPRVQKILIFSFFAFSTCLSFLTFSFLNWMVIILDVSLFEWMAKNYKLVLEYDISDTDEYQCEQKFSWVCYKRFKYFSKSIRQHTFLHYHPNYSRIKNIIDAFHLIHTLLSGHWFASSCQKEKETGKNE